MKDELKQTFTYRITRANQSELMVILTEMFLEYFKEAIQKMNAIKADSADGVKPQAEGEKNAAKADSADGVKPQAEDYRSDLKHARACLYEFNHSLPRNMQGETAELVQRFTALYHFTDQRLSHAEISSIKFSSVADSSDRNEIQELEAIEKMWEKLHAALAEAGKKDTSAPLMQNTEKIYAGMTYGRNDISESSSNLGTNRGFFA